MTGRFQHFWATQQPAQDYSRAAYDIAEPGNPGGGGGGACIVILQSIRIEGEQESSLAFAGLLCSIRTLAILSKTLPRHAETKTVTIVNVMQGLACRRAAGD